MPTTRRYVKDDQAAADLANALTHLPDKWVMCRDMRHSWDVVEDFHVTMRSGRSVQEIARVLGCMRCMTHRREIYHQGRFGLDKVSQTYSYPENYQIKGVPRGVKPQSIIQQEQFRRSMERTVDNAKGRDDRSER